MGARSIPPPPLLVRRVLHVLWPLVGVVVTGLMVPVVVAGAFMVLVDRRARLFRAACLAVVLMWVDIRMLRGLLGAVGEEPRPLLADLARGPRAAVRRRPSTR